MADEGKMEAEIDFGIQGILQSSKMKTIEFD